MRAKEFFIEGKSTQAKISNPVTALNYALKVIKGRFPEGEKAIASDPRCALKYATRVLKGRFPEGEKAIASEPWLAQYYARNVIRGRWPEAEKEIASDPHSLFNYAKNVIRGRWFEMEERLVTDPAFKDAAYRYAQHFIKDVKNRKSTPLSWIKSTRAEYIDRQNQMRDNEFFVEEKHTGGALGLPFPGTYEQEYNMFKRKGPMRITAMTSEEDESLKKTRKKVKLNRTK